MNKAQKELPDKQASQQQLELFQQDLSKYERNYLEMEQFLSKARKVAEAKAVELETTIQEMVTTIQTIKAALKPGWVATDKNGDIYWYRRKPVAYQDGWNADLSAPLDSWCLIGKLNKVVKNWRKSLVYIAGKGDEVCRY